MAKKENKKKKNYSPPSARRIKAVEHWRTVRYEYNKVLHDYLEGKEKATWETVLAFRASLRLVAEKWGKMWRREYDREQNQKR